MELGTRMKSELVEIELQSWNSVSICKVEPPDDDADVVFETPSLKFKEQSCAVQLTHNTAIEYDESVIKSEIEIEPEKFEAMENSIVRIKSKSVKRRTDANLIKSSEKSMECYLCHLVLKEFRMHRMADHMRKHTGDLPFRCLICRKKFSSKRKLGFHMKYHPSQTLNCVICRHRFINATDLKEHEAMCVLKRRYECHLCKSLFSYLSSLKRHMPQHTGIFKFNCKYCPKGYTRREYLSDHLKKHSNESLFKCKNCQARFDDEKSQMEHFGKCSRRKLFQCQTCEYSTISGVFAENHKRMHLGTDKFKCWHCTKVFLQLQDVLCHVKNVHNKKSLFECPHCYTGYCRWNTWNKHVKNCLKNKKA